MTIQRDYDISLPFWKQHNLLLPAEHRESNSLFSSNATCCGTSNMENSIHVSIWMNQSVYIIEKTGHFPGELSRWHHAPSCSRRPTFLRCRCITECGCEMGWLSHHTVNRPVSFRGTSWVHCVFVQCTQAWFNVDLLLTAGDRFRL